jgi:cell division protein FtsB
MTGRLLLAALLALAAALQYRLWLSDQGMPEVSRLRGAIASQRAENESLTERNEQLEAEVQDLRQGLDAVEERARTELGMVGRGESFFQVVEDPPARDEREE